MEKKEKAPTQEEINDKMVKCVNSIMEDLQIKNEIIRGMQMQIDRLKARLDKLDIASGEVIDDIEKVGTMNKIDARGIPISICSHFRSFDRDGFSFEEVIKNDNKTC